MVYYGAALPISWHLAVACGWELPGLYAGMGVAVLLGTAASGLQSAWDLAALRWAESEGAGEDVEGEGVEVVESGGRLQRPLLDDNSSMGPKQRNVRTRGFSSVNRLYSMKSLLDRFEINESALRVHVAHFAVLFIPAALTSVAVFAAASP